MCNFVNCLNDSDNVYLTDRFIVIQKFSFYKDRLFNSLVSNDTYFSITRKRLKLFYYHQNKSNLLFSHGKRIKVSMYTRNYFL